MEFYTGFDIESREKDMEFVYGPDVFHISGKRHLL